jgi:tetratricopeptide (TPR) repeat protein
MAMLVPLPLLAQTPAEVRAQAAALLTAATQKALRGDPQEVGRIDEALTLYRRIEDQHGEALALVVRAFAALSRSDYTAASADLEEAVRIFAVRGDRFSAGMVLWMAGMSERLDGQAETARTHLERSLGLFESVIADARGASFTGMTDLARFLAPSTPMPEMPPVEAAMPLLASLFSGMAHDELGATLVDLDRLDEAEAELGKAEATSRMLGGMLDSSVYAHLGALCRRQWRLDDAKAYLERALAGTGAAVFALFALDHRLEIQAMGRLAEIESLRGQLESALQWNTKALELARQDGRREREAAVLEDRGELLMRHDRLQDAETAWLAALPIAKEAKDRRREASVQTELGNLSFTRAAFESAVTYLESARDIYRELHEPLLETTTTALLFDAYLRLGAEESAASVLADARQAAQQDGSSLATASLTLLDLFSTALQHRSSPQDASDFLAKARRWLAAAHFDPDQQRSIEAVLRPVAALLTLESPNRPLSEIELDAVEQSARVGIPQTKLMADFCLWVSALRRGDLASARARADAALAEAKVLQDEEMTGYALLMLSAVSLREEKRDEALDLQRRAVASLEHQAEGMHSDAMLAAFFGGARHVIYDVVIAQLAKNGLAEEAFTFAERARARALLHQLANTRVGTAHGGDPALVARAEALRRTIAEWERERSGEEGVARTVRDEDIAHAKADYEGLTARAAMTNLEYASLLGAAPLDLAAVRRALAAHQTLISYFVTGERVHAWVLSRESFAYVPLTLGKDGAEDAWCLAAELGHFTSSVAPTNGLTPAEPVTRGVETLSGCPADAARAGRLYQQLVAPLLPSIHGEELVIVPHGVLHQLPFAALLDAGGEPLVARYALSYLPSASVLPFLAGKQSPFAGRALVLGAPATDARLPALPGAAREAREVAALWGTEAWLGTDATESRLYDLGGRVDLVHVAAHALVDQRSSSFSRIALAADATRDGNLELRELLAGVDLAGVNLVVLSACDTALGRRSAGDEVMSLARAILYAGSPAVLSTLWRLDDEAAVELVRSFYQGLRRGTSAAESLRQAQLAVRRRFPDPYHWAAFTLTGELTLAPAGEQPAVGR